MPTRNILTLTAYLFAFAIVGAAQTKINKVEPIAVSPADGKGMFMEYCAVCHGPEGKGNGPAASALKKAPADLTQLAAHSSDGNFPAVHVSRYIAGDDTVLAHGTRDMPIWGDVFKSMAGGRTATLMRVSNLTDYVKSIQAK
ncbi:MAG: c-type cytochrome [Bryobacteraceae bacterium]|jgi:mono/diheme cytochrome c family protein